MLCMHCLRTWSSTQPVEAEYYALVEGSTRCLGLQTMLRQLGVDAGVVVISTDSSSAKSFASRRGLGKMRHIEAKELWLHAAVRRGRIQLKKVDGTASPADLFAKYLSNPEIDKHLCTMNLRRIQVCKDDSTATST